MHTNDESAKTNPQLFTNRWTVQELEVQLNSNGRTNIFINSGQDAYQVFKTHWDKKLLTLQQQFAVLFTNHHKEVIAYRTINTGDFTWCNHPDGKAQFTPYNHALANEVEEVAHIFGMELLDHILLLPNDGLSMKDCQEGPWLPTVPEGN